MNGGDAILWCCKSSQEVKSALHSSHIRQTIESWAVSRGMLCLKLKNRKWFPVHLSNKRF